MVHIPPHEQVHEALQFKPGCRCAVGAPPVQRALEPWPFVRTAPLRDIRIELERFHFHHQFHLLAWGNDTLDLFCLTLVTLC